MGDQKGIIGDNYDKAIRRAGIAAISI
jgi:hypothetical protein